MLIQKFILMAGLDDDSYYRGSWVGFERLILSGTKRNRTF